MWETEDLYTFWREKAWKTIGGKWTEKKNNVVPPATTTTARRPPGTPSASSIIDAFCCDEGSIAEPTLPSYDVLFVSVNRMQHPIDRRPVKAPTK
jgi:hypothetical protein